MNNQDNEPTITNKLYFNCSIISSNNNDCKSFPAVCILVHIYRLIGRFATEMICKFDFEFNLTIRLVLSLHVKHLRCGVMLR